MRFFSIILGYVAVMAIIPILISLGELATTAIERLSDKIRGSK